MTNTEGSAGPGGTTDTPDPLAADQYSWGNGLSSGADRPAAGSHSTFAAERLAADQYPGGGQYPAGGQSPAGQQSSVTDPAVFGTPPPVPPWTPTPPPTASVPPGW